MLKYADYDIVFQEIPEEVTLAINISNCPHRCKGCHSPYLRDDVGNVLDQRSLAVLLGKYSGAVTCVCFMGGDADPEEVCRLAAFVREKTGGKIKTGWYSGCGALKNPGDAAYFDFIKLGPYIPSLGGLNKKTTNQRLYKVSGERLTDITACMQR